MSIRIQYGSSDDVIIDAIIREHLSADALVVMLHGINSDKNEEGFFINLSNALDYQKFNILRFDFRGHGNSTCPNGYMTIQGESNDFLNALMFMRKRWGNKPIIIIAASFGAVPVLNTVTHLPLYPVIGIVLINPVLDLQKTFLYPCYDWPKLSFNENSYRHLNDDGYFRLDGKIKIGKQLFREIQKMKPYEELSKIRVPVLMIHGDSDHYVSYDISKKYSANLKTCDFVTISGADHGFDNPKDELMVVNIIKNWISSRATPHNAKHAKM